MYRTSVFTPTVSEDEPFRRFNLGNSLQTMQCPANPPLLCSTIFNTREENVPSIGRRPQWDPSNLYCKCSGPNTVQHRRRDYRKTPQHAPSTQTQNPPPSRYVTKTSATPPPRKIDAKVQRTVTFPPSGLPPDGVVSYMTRGDSAITINTKRGSGNLFKRETIHRTSHTWFLKPIFYYRCWADWSFLT